MIDNYIIIFRISRDTNIVKINRYLCDILQSVQRVKISIFRITYNFDIYSEKN